MATNSVADVLGALAVSIAVLAAFDRAASSRRARWFSVHAFGNALVSLLSVPALAQWLRDPVTSMNEEKFPTPRCLSADGVWAVNSLWPTVLIIAQHLYHLAAFSKVSFADIWHHLAFVPVIGVWGGLILQWGPLRNVLGFFISGLPGGVDYACLVLHKHDVMTKRQQKVVSVGLALLVRAPGLLLEAFTMYVARLYGETKTGWPFVAMIIAFVVCNALYYLQQVIGAYYVFCLKEQQAREVTLGAGLTAKPAELPVSPRCAPKRSYRRHLPS